MLTLVRNSAINAVRCSILGERMLQNPSSCLFIPGNRTGANVFDGCLAGISWAACRICNQIEVAIQHFDSDSPRSQSVDTWLSDGRSLRTTLYMVIIQKL